MSPAVLTLLEERGIAFRERVSMAERTTLRVGGPAACWVEATGPEDIVAALAVASQAGADAYIVGNGSNLLVRDGGFDGLVICVGPAMDTVRVEGSLIHAQAGARLAQVAMAAQAAGLSGMEALAGVPGTIGGAACMNAGCYGVEMSQVVAAVEVLTRKGERKTLTAGEMAFGYRKSAVLAQDLIVTGVTLSLAPGDPGAIAGMMRDFARQRREKQPLTMPSAGSFFKRPEGYFAGALIEQAGLKGESVGGAMVSPMHAGFLVNTGGAAASDFLSLMALVQARVRDNSGIWLEAEVQIIGCDSSY